MGLTAAQVDAAEKVQRAAARDPAKACRVIAGPGTGKSTAIEERVRWLVEDAGAARSKVKAISFTRASSADLRQRVHRYLEISGLSNPGLVQVSTLHSLAFSALRRAGHLAAYPVSPMVLDEWEQRALFDDEFPQASAPNTNLTPKRARVIRRFHEAHWATGSWNPTNYIPPDPPVSAEEQQAFEAFHALRSQTYAAVLPGEIVRQCVTQVRAGLLDVRDLLGIDHLVVDEYQDLNAMDLEFVRAIQQSGATLWVAGDDDQSIYSFRFAMPEGIRNFETDYPGSNYHSLADRFRCTPQILSAAEQVLSAHSGPMRIPKNTSSLYLNSAPPVPGVVERWRFGDSDLEAEGVAEACADLIGQGESPGEILILINNKRPLTKKIGNALDVSGVPYDSFRSEGFKDTDVGRFVLSVLRIVCDGNDYVAHRVLLQTIRGVGIKTCAAIADGVASENLNFKDVFYDRAAHAHFTRRARSALDRAADICARIARWECQDELHLRLDSLGEIVQDFRSAGDAEVWDAVPQAIPASATLAEVRDFIWAETDAQQDAVVERVFEREGSPNGTSLPTRGTRVRLLTLHGSKGLSARFVLIPGLEEAVFPGAWRRPYVGLIQEAARLLYVGMTRARVGLVLSFADQRQLRGPWQRMTPSRFSASTGGAFAAHTGGFGAAGATALMSQAADL